ncbi:type VI secretion system lipoprotein TssJ [Xenorhabdus khoisanae]|uniref:type VI secretion system lipoprotein TssJ n=1 Tax=Xenorhabdus khoisanae TaxID=880157 RepID=UPI002359D136|nr:type VI secretion system lipoprotein TssJ [Xenorhabdus khoisanae]MDC9613932.1 type VI secretion system lipoprotein TssJ [Xenorhabdus khoisanae]
MDNAGNIPHEKRPFSDKTRRVSANKLSLNVKWIRVILFSLVLMAFTGCSSSSEQKKLPPYKLIFDIPINANNSAPLKIHVILLRSDVEFMSADFFSLQEKAEMILGNKLVNADQFFLLPTQKKRFWLEKNTPEASYIGIFAEYKQLNGKRWRISFPVPEPEEPAFYQFWASSPDELDIYIQVTDNGLNLINKDN